MSVKALLLALAAALVWVATSLLRLAPGGPQPGGPAPTPVPARRPPRPPRRPARRPAAPPLTSALFDSRPVTFPLGWRPAVVAGPFAAGSRPFVYNEVHGSHHQLVLGTTGSGKSRYCELQCRFLIDALRGFCFIDPDGDTAENLLAYALKKAEEEGSDAICRQIVYVELSFATLPSFDPFAPPDFSDLPPGLRENAYRAWLSVKVDAFCEVVQSKQGAGDFVGMARLQRALRNVLTAVGTAVDPSGRHLPLSEVFALLDCDHRRHAEVYAVVAPHLPEDVRAEFERWHGADRRQRLQETESSLNRLRSLLSPLVMAIFTEPARRISFRDTIDARMILLVNLRQSDFLSADQQRAIATLFVHEIMTASMVADRYERPVCPYYLYIDEASLLMETCGSELENILKRGRKYKLSLTLIGQFLGQFRNDRIDMIPAVLNLCRSFACFLHSSPDDLDILKHYFGYPNLDFAELMQVTDRPDGYELLKLTDYARSYTCGTNWSLGASANQSTSTSQQVTHSEQHTAGVSDAAGAQASRSVGAVANTGVSQLYDAHGRPSGTTASAGGAASAANSSGTSQVHTVQSSDSTGISTARGTAEQHGTGSNVSLGGNEGRGVTETEKTTVVPKTREEWHPTGRLRTAVEDQFHRVAQVISSLRNRQAVVRLFGEERTFRMDVGDVPDVFPEPREMAERVRAFKARIFASHPFYFTPDLSPGAEARRLDAWLRGGAGAADDPLIVGGADESGPFA